jgi:tetratricopeptide (TPR) repeat protein
MKTKDVITKILNKKDMYSRWSYKEGDIDKKISYLDMILKKEGLLREETRKAVYDVLGDLAFSYDSIRLDQRGITNPSLAIEYYQRGGLEDKIVDLKKKVKQYNEEGDKHTRKYFSDGSSNCVEDLGSAVLYYRMAGNKNGILRVAEIDLREGRLKCAEDEYLDAEYIPGIRRIAKEYIEDGRREDITKAISLYQKINDKESIKTLADDFAEKKSLFMAANLYKKIGDFESASKMLELASKEMLSKASTLSENEIIMRDE